MPRKFNGIRSNFANEWGKMTQLSLSDDAILELYMDDTDKLERFTHSARYKMRIRRYVQQIETNRICFKNTLTIHDMQKVINTIKSVFSNVIIDNELTAYIQNRDYYITSRYRLGNDIKRRDRKVDNQFQYFASVVSGAMIRPLTTEQMWNAFYMYVMKNVSNFSVPGSGKTATVLGTYAYGKHHSTMNKIVMIGPKNSFGSWIDEYQLCFGEKSDTFYLNIHNQAYNTPQKRKFALQFDSGAKELILINYESIQSLSEAIKEVIDENTLLVFDEVHKIKNPTGQRATVAKDVSVNASAIIALTGTPIPNSYVDIYNILNILYPEDYKDFFGFSTSELKKAGPEQITLLNEKFRPFFCRTSKEQLRVPPANEDIIFDIAATNREERLFKILYQTYRNNLFALLVRILQLESNPQLLLQNIDYSDLQSIIDDESNFSEDVTVQDYSEDITHLVSQIEVSSKTVKTIKLVEQLITENKKMIIWCIFVSSIHLLRDICTKKGWKVKCIYGEISLDDRLKIIKDFRNGAFDILITNPHTLAESVSLHTICHDAIYYEYSFNLVHLLQSKDRIHRLGLADDQYTQYYFMKCNYTYNNDVVSIDGRIYGRLKEKETTMLEAIDNDILENVTSVEEDLQLIFRDF